MKNSIVRTAATCLLLLASVIFAGCNKDNEGPNKAGMLASGSWKLKAINGSTNLTGTLTVTFAANKDYKEIQVSSSGVTYTYEGEWQLTNNDSEIEIEYTDGDEWNIDIEELTTEKLVVEDDGNEYEFKH